MLDVSGDVFWRILLIKFEESEDLQKFDFRSQSSIILWKNFVKNVSVKI